MSIKKKKAKNSILQFTKDKNLLFTDKDSL